MILDIYNPQIASQTPILCCFLFANVVTIDLGVSDTSTLQPVQTELITLYINFE